MFVCAPRFVIVLEYVKKKAKRFDLFNLSFTVCLNDSKGSTATENLSRQIQTIQNAASMGEKQGIFALERQAADGSESAKNCLFASVYNRVVTKTKTFVSITSQRLARLLS